MSTVEKKKKARSSKRKNVENLFKRVMDQIESPDKPDIADVLSTRDTLVEKFDSIKILDEQIFDMKVELAAELIPRFL